MNLLIFFLICVFFHFNAIKADEESDEAKYIDLLPEKEKKAFLEKIARRIIEEVQSQDVKLASGEMSDDQLNQHSEFVSKLLKEEQQILRRGGNETEQKNKEEAPPAEEENADVQSLENDKLYANRGEDKSKQDIIDLTFRAGRRSKRYESGSTGISDEKELNTEISYDNSTVKAVIDEKSDNNISVEITIQKANSEINPNVTVEGHHVADNIMTKGDHVIPVKVVYENDTGVKKENENVSETPTSSDIVDIATSESVAPKSNSKEIAINGLEHVNSSRRSKEVNLKEIQKHSNDESTNPSEKYKSKENIKTKTIDFNKNVTEQDASSSKEYSLLEIEVDVAKSNKSNVTNSTVADENITQIYRGANVSDYLEHDNSTLSASETSLNAEIRSENSSASLETNFEEKKTVQLNQDMASSSVQEQSETKHELRSSQKLDVMERITNSDGLNTSSEEEITGIMSSTHMPHILTTSKVSDIISSEHTEISTSQTAETIISHSNLLNNHNEITSLANAKIDISQVQTTNAPIVHSTNHYLRMDKETENIEPKGRTKMTNMQSKLSNGIIPIFHDGTETQIENSKKFLALQSKYTESKVKEYQVYEIRAGETPFVPQKIKPPKQENHAHYVPVYNYAPSNAYFNPYNRLGPNLEDLNDENERDENRKYSIRINDAQKANKALRTNYGEFYDDWNFEDRPKLKEIKRTKKPPPVTNNKTKIPFDMHLLNHSDGRYLERYLERRSKTNDGEQTFVLPNSNEKNHPYNEMASIDLKDHLSLVRKILNKQQMYGQEISSTTTGILPLRSKGGRQEQEKVKPYDILDNYIGRTTPKSKKLKKLNKGIAADYYFGRSEPTDQDFKANLDIIDPDNRDVSADYWLGRYEPHQIKYVENYPVINGKSYIKPLLNYKHKNKFYENDNIMNIASKTTTKYGNSFNDELAGNNKNDPKIINISNGKPYINTLIDYKQTDIEKADSDVVNFGNGKAFINSFMDYSNVDSHSKSSEGINVAIGTPFNRDIANKHNRDDMLNIAIGKPSNRFIDYNIVNNRNKNAYINNIAIGKPLDRIFDYNNNKDYYVNNLNIGKPYFNNFNGYKDANERIKDAYVLSMVNDKPHISPFVDYKTANKYSKDYYTNNIAIGKPYVDRFVDYKPENDNKQPFISISNGKPYITTFTDYKIANKYRSSENAKSGKDDAVNIAEIRPVMRIKNFRDGNEKEENKENEEKKKDDNEETSQLLTPDDKRILLNMVDTRDVIPTLDMIHSIMRSDSGIGPYLVVIKDMVKTDADALEKYDWLGTTVDIQSALKKIKDLINDLENDQIINPADMQLLKYITYLHKVCQDYLARYSEQPDLRGRLPRNRRKRKSQKLISWNRKWLVRTEIPGPIFTEHLKEFVLFVEDLEQGLYEIHNAIKHISIVTKYTSQRWYENLKQLYLSKATNKEYLDLLLHLFTSKLVALIEYSAGNGLEDDFIQYMEQNKDLLKETMREFVMVLRLLTKLQRIQY